ncbi:4-carboxy-2-hydroxymuconate-6-semialdehyde dehydrogenase [bacterium HR17]|uniref:4-carboxy-2-hydroxymuconate-6-semialdehyde dehydrogenase n=1 Tax=Candidatus Fervidibacter japonicus TaxID=2035412 RepID=A0A2H5XC12_9BACT|nr:4-carboxy-2-hydroxymuconate-6-semialdehyde dehydrogenase [bacterium HR17]
MAGEKTRIGFVGCGGIAQQHMNALAQMDGVQLVAFCDIVAEKAHDAAQRFNGHAFTDVTAMLDSVEVDALFFCLPPFAHGAELVAVERGIPFFVEKPVGLDWGLIKEITAAVQEKNLLTSVGYMNRYRRGVNRVRELLRVDPPILLLGGWVGRTPQARPGEGIWRWWVQKDKSGGQFHEQVTHTVDLVRYLAGDIVEVHAYAAKGLNRLAPEGYTIEDAVAVTLRFANGAVADLWACCAANGGGGGITLQVFATETTAEFRGWEHSLRLYRRGEDIVEIPGEPNIFAIEDAAFVDAVRRNDPSLIRCPYQDGAKTAAVTLAVNASLASGRPETVPTL